MLRRKLEKYLNRKRAQQPALSPATIACYERAVKQICEASPPGIKGKKPDSIIAAISDQHGARSAEIAAFVLRATGVALKATQRRPQSKPETVIWTADQLRTFFETEKHSPYLVAWLLAGLCGLRRGEICGLEWGDVSDSTLHIKRSRIAVNGAVITKSPKSSSSARGIPLPAPLMAALEAHRSAQTAFAPWIGAEPPAAIITTPQGKAISPGALSHAFKRAVERAGLPATHLHALRHTCATLMLNQGVHLRIIQQILGHSSYSVTARVYTHATMEAERIALDTLTRETVKWGSGST